jgi:hypothetical protein
MCTNLNFNVMRSYSPPIEYFHLGRVDKSERLFGAKRRLTFSSRNLRSNHTSSRSFDQSSFSSSSTFHSPNLDSVQIKERNLLPLRCSDDKGQNNPFQVYWSLDKFYPYFLTFIQLCMGFREEEDKFLWLCFTCIVYKQSLIMPKQRRS